MGDFKTRAIYTTSQNVNDSFVSYTGAEGRKNFSAGYLGAGLFVATNGTGKDYGLVDLKGKLNYDSKGIFDQNLRIRTALDKDIKSIQFRYSPITLNLPITDDVSFSTNTHYTAKFDNKSKSWKHSLGNFTAFSWDIDKKNNLTLEGQAYNLQDLKNNTGDDWSVNLMYTHKF